MGASQRAGSVGKVLATSLPGTHDGKTEMTLKSCPLAITHTLWHVHAHINITYTQ